MWPRLEQDYALESRCDVSSMNNKSGSYQNTLSLLIITM